MNALPRLLASLLATTALAAPATAFAWWNADFKQRTQVTLNTSAAGVETREAISGAAVPVRLHSGNFDFLAAKPDGSDLRVVAADDKTPLKFRIERFDGTNELAVLWVQVPTVAPGSDKNLFYIYAGNEKAAAEPAAPVHDGAVAAAFDFAQADGQVADHSGALKATAPATVEANGLVGPALRLAGTAVEFAPSDKLKAAAGAPWTINLWVKPDTAGGTVLSLGPLSLALDGAKPVVKLGNATVTGGDLPANAWAQIAVVLATGKATLYVNGTQAAQGDIAGAPAIEGALRLGGGFNGLVDTLQIATAPRSADWLKFQHAAQGADAKLVASVTQNEANASEGDGGHGGHFAILWKNLTLDAIIVMVILGVMFVIAMWVMIAKAFLIVRTDSGNHAFLTRFRDSADVMRADGAKAHPGSSLARLYDAGVRELAKRDVGQPGAAALSGVTIDAVKAAVDADLVRENHRLNSWMVLLTIAISGGPFLGLLGTVVGVMITFAAIAAAGDVNVNAIAPGIAAALLATVAGLGVAIPALFGYNYLASRIKNISADMQIFVDEFVTRVAERYGAR